MINLNDPTSEPKVTLLPADEVQEDSASHGEVAVEALENYSTDEHVVAPRPPEIPTLLNTFQFFALAVTVTLIVGFLCIGFFQLLPPFRHHDFRSVALDPRLTIPSQAIQYLALLAFTVMLFRNIWQRPFWQSLEWNASTAIRRWIPLVAIGLLLGLVNGVASNYLPMPKEAPILNDLMRNATGAWLMFLFGTTFAPLMEEVAFRGFLLPSLVHFFRRERLEKHSIEADLPARATPRTPSSIGIPASILLASLPFALLHGEQVSWAWAPVILIGIISVALCIVRLWTRSLAASALVHAIYNFTLFAGMLIASDGFRHLDKLKN